MESHPEGCNSHGHRSGNFKPHIHYYLLTESDNPKAVQSRLPITHSRCIYCTVLTVLVGFKDYTTQLFTLFYCRLHESVLQAFFTVDSDPLMSCVGAVCCYLPSSKAI
jgi:hypothetical protein